MNCLIACLMFVLQAHAYFLQTSLLISISNDFSSWGEVFSPDPLKLQGFLMKTSKEGDENAAFSLTLAQI